MTREGVTRFGQHPIIIIAATCVDFARGCVDRQHQLRLRPRLLLLGIPTADAIAGCSDGAAVVDGKAVGVRIITTSGVDVADINLGDCS
jgi:hypothetical protein